MSDNVNRPHHYADSCSLECIQAMQIAFGKQAVIDFCLCNAFKYLWRYKNKNGTEDICKAEWYCNYASKLDDEETDCESRIKDLQEIIAEINTNLTVAEINKLYGNSQDL